MNQYYPDPDREYKMLLEERDSIDIVSPTNYTDSHNWNSSNLLDISKEDKQVSKSMQEKLNDVAKELEVILADLLQKVENEEQI